MPCSHYNENMPDFRFGEKSRTPRTSKQGALTAVSSYCYLLLYMCPHTGVVERYPSSCVLQRPVYAFRCASFFSLLLATIPVSSYRCPYTYICVPVHVSFFFNFFGEMEECIDD
jgi:hypothetical protein